MKYFFGGVQLWGGACKSVRPSDPGGYCSKTFRRWKIFFGLLNFWRSTAFKLDFNCVSVERRLVATSHKFRSIIIIEKKWKILANVSALTTCSFSAPQAGCTLLLLVQSSVFDGKPHGISICWGILCQWSTCIKMLSVYSILCSPISLRRHPNMSWSNVSLDFKNEIIY